MGGRGGYSGLSGAGGADYQAGYSGEMENARDFPAAYAIDPSATKESIGYMMHAHKEATGQSLIAETNNDIAELQRAYKSAYSDGKAYGLSQGTINGIKAGIKEKISLRQQAVKAMTGARAEYEKYANETRIGNAKAKSRRGRWM